MHGIGHLYQPESFVESNRDVEILDRLTAGPFEQVIKRCHDDILGSVGLTIEYDIGFYLKRARTAELTFGDAAWHRERWATLSGY